MISFSIFHSEHFEESVRVRVRVRVRFTLRLTVYRQSICFGAKPLETHDQNLFAI
jgi:hypothetical protein